MQVIILAGGFAKRLLPLSNHTPKPLLKIGGRRIIEYVVQRVMEIDNIDGIIISTNLRFKPQFEEWLSSTNLKARLVVEPSQREEEKPGAVVALARIAKDVNDDCLVIAGDNLFTSSLRPLAERFHSTGRPVMGIYNLGDNELARQYSTITLDSNGLIVGFVEKPLKPESTLIGTAIYFLPKSVLPLLNEFTAVSPNRDSPGRFIEWLYTRVPTYGVVLKGEWWDIGTLDQYEKVNRLMSQSRFGEDRFPT